MLRLELVDISKSYPAVKANDRVSLPVAPGQIHAVLGENGAGKSTLMKIIYGAVRPDAGEIRWNGERVEIASPAEARALGISMVYQHFSLFDTLTAAENVWLGLAGEIGSLDVGAAADICVWDAAVGAVATRRAAVARTLHERVFAWMTLADERNLVQSFVAGRPHYDRDAA